MKPRAFYMLMGVLAVSAVMTRPALAQTETPPAGPMGEVMGTIINKNTGAAVAEELDVMLHILGQDNTEAGMLHGRSQADGAFLFTAVPFDADSQYAVMAIYDGVTYFSATAPADMTSREVALEVPVYESTSSLAGVQVDQMHVLFNLAEDGMETNEIYVLSNKGERTVKDVFQLDGDRFATLEFPLPTDADYVFFKPDDQDRFVKIDGGFVDTYPILPGEQSAQIMVNYLVPFSPGRIYTLTAPLNIARMDFLLQENSKLSLQGTGLTGPEQMTLRDGESYFIYTLAGLRAGETITVSFVGQVNNPQNQTNIPLAGGVAFLGIAMIGLGVLWWRKSGKTQSGGDDLQTDEPTLDELLAEIAQLDGEHERGIIGTEEYQRLRQELLQSAKRLL